MTPEAAGYVVSQSSWLSPPVPLVAWQIGRSWPDLDLSTIDRIDTTERTFDWTSVALLGNNGFTIVRRTSHR
jgi:hypothetical protein